jgi:hypothetical protein
LYRGTGDDATDTTLTTNTTIAEVFCHRTLTTTTTDFHQCRTGDTGADGALAGHAPETIGGVFQFKATLAEFRSDLWTTDAATSPANAGHTTIIVADTHSAATTTTVWTGACGALETNADLTLTIDSTETIGLCLKALSNATTRRGNSRTTSALTNITLTDGATETIGGEHGTRTARTARASDGRTGNLLTGGIVQDHPLTTNATADRRSTQRTDQIITDLLVTKRATEPVLLNTGIGSRSTATTDRDRTTQRHTTSSGTAKTSVIVSCGANEVSVTATSDRVRRTGDANTARDVADTTAEGVRARDFLSARRTIRDGISGTDLFDTDVLDTTEAAIVVDDFAKNGVFVTAGTREHRTTLDIATVMVTGAATVTIGHDLEIAHLTIGHGHRRTGGFQATKTVTAEAVEVIRLTSKLHPCSTAAGTSCRTTQGATTRAETTLAVVEIAFGFYVLSGFAARGSDLGTGDVDTAITDATTGVPGVVITPDTSATRATGT